MAELRKRQDHNRVNRQKREELQALDARIERGKEAETDLIRKIEELQSKLASTRSELGKLQHHRDILDGEIQSLAEQDEQEILDQMENAQETNRKIQEAKARFKAYEEKGMLETKVTALTQEIQAIDEAKAQALQDASFPVPGLSFDENSVLLNGIHFSQASQAEQLQVSVAMGFAMNPELKVLLVRDGSLLDDNSLQHLAEMAAEQDGQVWLERVGEGDGCAVVIEDGRLKPRPGKRPTPEIKIEEFF